MGPAIGYLAGGAFLNFYVDIDSADLNRCVLLLIALLNFNAWPNLVTCVTNMNKIGTVTCVQLS